MRIVLRQCDLFCWSCIYTFQISHTCNQDIFYTTVLQTVQNGKPEFHTFVLPNIHSEYIFMSFHVDPDSDINRTFYNPAFVAYMEIIFSSMS